MQAAENASEKLIDDDRVAEMLGVDVVVVRRWRMANQGPQFLRLSRSVYRYRPSDVISWIESRQRGGEQLAEHADESY